MAKKWTSDDIDLVRSLRAERLTIQEISDAIGRTYAATRKVLTFHRILLDNGEENFLEPMELAPGHIAADARSYEILSRIL